MGNLALITPKLSKLIPMLATSHDGEVVATVRAIDRTLKAAGLDFHSLVGALHLAFPLANSAPRLETPEGGMTLREMALWCRSRDGGDLTDKERRFVWDIVHRTSKGGELTEKQASWLRAIHAKLNRDHVP